MGLSTTDLTLRGWIFLNRFVPSKLLSMLHHLYHAHTSLAFMSPEKRLPALPVFYSTRLIVSQAFDSLFARPRRILPPSPKRRVLLPSHPLNLLPLLRLTPNNTDANISLLPQLLLPNPLKRRMLIKTPCHPQVQILHIRNRVHNSTRTQHVCVLGAERGGDNAGFVLAGFEVRVGEEEVDGMELGAGEVVG